MSLLSMMSFIWSGCRDFAIDDQINADLATKPVNVDLAFTFSSHQSGNQTRQADAVVDGSGRTVTIQRIVPLKGIEPSSSIIGSMQSIEKPNDATTPEAKFFYYKNCLLSRGVDRFLVYGQAVDGSDKSNFGSLVSNIPYPVQSISDISFSLESIYKSSEYTTTNGIPAGASTLAGYLNTVANVTNWKTSTNSILKNLFENFINHGYDLPGSAASVKKWLEAVKEAAEDYLDPAKRPSSIGDAEETILNNIVSAVNGITINNSYPRGLYLPDGAAVVRWDGRAFVPVMQTTTLDNINSVSRFAYPAALHFYVNSPIKTSNEPVKFNNVYEPNTTTAWSQVLASYTSGDRITSETQAVALRDPVQYAVAQLKVTVKAKAQSLSDNTSPTPQSITVGGSSFPLTGIIVCGQREVGFDFAPKDNSDADVKFIYDSQVTSGSYLTTSGTQPTTTLVLQSYDGENVNIILEFENASTQPFRCIDGFVYPGTRFYLIGEIDATTGTGTKPDGKNRVFTKDYITEVNMQVVSLAKAYNVLPNILSSNLEIGVMTTPQWIAAEPESVKLN